MFTQWISELEDQKNEIENKYTEELKELNDLIESLQKENEELQDVKNQFSEVNIQIDQNEK